MNEIAGLLLLAVLAEAIWETLKMIKVNNGISTDRLGAIVIAVIITVSGNVDFFKIAGLPLNIPYLGSVFTGIIVSRGANFVHDLLKITESIMIKNKV
ncbi:hypothetical protein [Thermosyntropha sp.]|uniref:hypothetical protein n=1 Tax=Thermosyntropha sp. TaxID=2740820 RepID=UPI0025EC7BA0|nr:hypothetical protein [Thermosyntropha sp.]MBO8158341.1 hypothetical protein [Thermosyntropha sp.]